MKLIHRDAEAHVNAVGNVILCLLVIAAVLYLNWS